LDLKREEVTGGWKKLHNEELCYKDSLANIDVIKTRRIRRVECVACFVFSSWHSCLQSSDIFHGFTLFFQALMILPLMNITCLSVYNSIVFLYSATLCSGEGVKHYILYYIVYINIIYIY
jgi:hypothetical protein